MKNGHSQKDQESVCKTNYSLMQVKSIEEFGPSLSYHISIRTLFCLFYTGFTVYAFIVFGKTVNINKNMNRIRYEKEKSVKRH